MSTRSGTPPISCFVKPPAGATTSPRLLASCRIAATSSADPGDTTAAGATPLISKLSHWAECSSEPTCCSPTITASSRASDKVVSAIVKAALRNCVSVSIAQLPNYQFPGRSFHGFHLGFGQRAGDLAAEVEIGNHLL